MHQQRILRQCNAQLRLSVWRGLAGDDGVLTLSTWRTLAWQQLLINRRVVLQAGLEADSQVLGRLQQGNVVDAIAAEEALPSGQVAGSLKKQWGLEALKGLGAFRGLEALLSRALGSLKGPQRSKGLRSFKESSGPQGALGTFSKHLPCLGASASALQSG